jgi:hypothetical protein
MAEKEKQLKLKHLAKAKALENQLKSDIKKHVQAIPEYQSLKLDLDLTKSVCRLVEDRVNNNKDKKIDKKQLVLSQLHELFTLTPEERHAISKHIDYLHSNGKLNKKWVKNAVRGVISVVSAFL